jgi:F-type H+-transporting ATPase subunit b
MKFDETFWVAVAFVAFIVVLFRPVKRMLLGALDARAAKIRNELDEAVRLREEAQALLARYERQQSEAAEEARGILEHAKEEAGRHSKEAAEALEAALERRRQQALDRIARAEQDAVAEVRGTAVDLAVRAARQLIAERLDEKAQAALVDDAIEDLDKKLH